MKSTGALKEVKEGTSIEVEADDSSGDKKNLWKGGSDRHPLHGLEGIEGVYRFMCDIEEAAR